MILDSTTASERKTNSLHLQGAVSAAARRGDMKLLRLLFSYARESDVCEFTPQRELELEEAHFEAPVRRHLGWPRVAARCHRSHRFHRRRAPSPPSSSNPARTDRR